MDCAGAAPATGRGDWDCWRSRFSTACCFACWWAAWWCDDSVAARKAWLYPLRDLMGFVFWVRSYFATRRLRYRGDPYELLPEGRLRKLN